MNNIIFNVIYINILDNIKWPIDVVKSHFIYFAISISPQVLKFGYMWILGDLVSTVFQALAVTCPYTTHAGEYYVKGGYMLGIRKYIQRILSNIKKAFFFK